MARDLTPEEVHELLGAYALDAVTPEERDQIERFLDQSPRARAEVAELRETAALLAHAGTDAPPGLWDRIAGSIADAPRELPPPPASGRPARDARRRWAAPVAAAAGIAAAVVAIVILSVQVVHQAERLRKLETDGPARGVLAAAEAARQDADARQVSLASLDGALRAELLFLPDGTGYLVDDNLAALPAGRVYQLWALAGTRGAPRAISAGVLGPDPGVSAFRFGGDVVGFVVTEEDAPGVVSSDNPPVLRGTVPD
jgi:Anti-sigma-K factor rskA